MVARHDRLPLRKVVVVFKTHFDLGFTDLPDQVLASYTGPMFNAVMDVMTATANEPPNLRYRWTLPAWPMNYLLHNQAVPEETRLAARRLVEDGRLNWHVWPFTTHTAFCGLEDLVRGLHISRSLSEEFGIWPVAAKQTDVPGHTWILPSMLVRAGVKFLHLGCNPGSHSPHVPGFFWWEGPDGSRLLTYYSPGGYGTPLLPPEDWPLDTWLAVRQTVDNAGPHRPEELAQMRSEVAEKAPHVEIVFGQLGDFAESLFERPEQLAHLPVVPYDLADTWIHGIGTMPREVARVRALRARIFAIEMIAALQDWPQDGSSQDFQAARLIASYIDEAYEQLMLFGEHTWGLDVKSTIKRVFSPEQFKWARTTEEYRRLESSWAAKAAYVDRAETALSSAEDLTGAVAHQATEHQGTPNHAEIQGPVIESRWFRVEVAPEVGGIISLIDKRTGREWVDRSQGEPFGGYRYDLYSASDIAEFMRAYGLFFQDWFVQDFGKAGCPEDSVHIAAYARDFELSDEGNKLTMVGGHLHPDKVQMMGVPYQDVSIEIALPGDVPCLDLTYRIHGKVATPFAESAVIPFPLNLPKPSFRLGQVGSVIDPFRDIAAGANHSLWCVDSWVDASDDRDGMGLIPVDMPLVSLGSVGIFEFYAEREHAKPVIYSHLYNTQWGTNFPQWLEGDFSFRIRLVPHSGDWRTARLWQTALDTARPTPLSSGDYPVRLSDGLTLLSLRPRHDGEGLIIRFRDALGLPRNANIELEGPVSAVWRCDLMERPLEKLPLAAANHSVRLELPIAAHAIETLLIEFEGSGVG